MDVVIVGAGLAGLTAARHLADGGLAVAVVDKARGPGGRLAARRMDSAVVEHGAQVLTARTLEFARQLQAWRKADVVAAWPCVAAPGGGWRGVPSMTAPAKALARDLDIRLGCAVASVARGGPEGEWQVSLADGTVLRTRAVLLTAPVPQSLALLDAGGVTLDAAVRQRLESVSYEPCLAVLAVLERPSRLPAEGLELDGGTLAWLADQQGKGVSPVPAAILHSTPDFAARHLDGDREEAARHLLDAAAPHLGTSVAVWQAHAWRYSRVTHADPAPFLALSAAPPLLLAGDAWGGRNLPRNGAEDAFRSGRAAAMALQEQLKAEGGA